MKQIEKYKKIINDLGNEIFGEGYIVAEASNNDERLHVRLILNQDVEVTPYTFIIEDNHYLLNDGWSDRIELKLTSLEVFKQYATQVLLKKCKPDIISAYKAGYIDTLPQNINFDKSIIYLNKISVGWFTETFDECTYNNESAENVKIVKTKDKVEITFDVDCKRYGVHRNNSLTINNRGLINYGFTEIVETIVEYNDLEKKITAYISTK